MLSRINQLPKFTNIIRQISTTNLILTKQYQVKSDTNVQPLNKKERKFTDPKRNNNNNNNNSQNNQNRKFNKNYDQNKPIGQKVENLVFTVEKQTPKLKNLFEKIPEKTAPTTTETRAKTQELRDVYNNIIESFKKNQNLSHQNLISPCQRLNDLYDQDASIAESFHSDPLKPSIINILIKEVDKMSPDAFFTLSQFILRFDSAKFDKIQPQLSSFLSKLNIEQILKTLILLRTPQLYKMELLDTVRNYTNSARDRLEEVENYSQLKLAMKIFNQEPLTSKKLDKKLLNLADKLKSYDWVDILNNKSIYRQRDMAILELCSYNLIKTKQLDLDSIQKCLLSCGVLNFHNEQFYKYLLECLSDELKKNPTKEWLVKNEKNLLSILASIGMLQLRDEKLLGIITEILEKNSDFSKLTINFITSCGGLNYKIPKDKLKNLTSKINVSNFDLNDRKVKVNLLNYVWSLCSLDIPDVNLINEVLSEKYWMDLLNQEENGLSLKKAKKAALLKLLNVNLYSILFMDDYKGANLPENFNISIYKDLFVENKPSYQNETLLSTLSSFRSVDKYFKLNLLTPFGINVDALMVVDKNGIPCQLAKFMNENLELDTSENEYKIAIKLITQREQTLLSRKLNGVIKFQIRLLKELGYRPLIINQEELKAATLVNRVNLIQNKLKDLVKN
ncbi:unnamed protein product [Brachionus calyciflorus]|uniref:FAST kinase-like protein subdomain 2 domain-containing protein n=1 Tax=Brachionus calyciflorus TaxID=104777 RepID=A0A813PE29_9BILA|nr:unnamed protein product [Brachionus calyciflorus]